MAKPSNRNEWYYLSGGCTHGPFTARKLKSLVLAGVVKSTTPVRKGSGAWRGAAHWKGLLATAEHAEANRQHAANVTARRQAWKLPQLGWNWTHLCLAVLPFLTGLLWSYMNTSPSESAQSFWAGTIFMGIFTYPVILWQITRNSMGLRIAVMTIPTACILIGFGTWLVSTPQWQKRSARNANAEQLLDLATTLLRQSHQADVPGGSLHGGVLIVDQAKDNVAEISLSRLNGYIPVSAQVSEPEHVAFVIYLQERSRILKHYYTRNSSGEDLDEPADAETTDLVLKVISNPDGQIVVNRTLQGSPPPSTASVAGRQLPTGETVHGIRGAAPYFEAKESIRSMLGLH